MINKTLRLIAILCLVSFSSLKAQNLNVHKKNGEISKFKLTDVKSLTFNSGNLQVNKIDNQTSEFAISDINLLRFKETTAPTGIAEADKNVIAVFPNPVAETLNVQISGNENGEVRIIDLQGKLIKAVTVNSQNRTAIPVAQLPAGMYFCQYKTGKNTKTIKFIKK